MIKKFKANSLHVEIYHTRAQLGQHAGEDAAAYLKMLLARQEEANVMFAAAPSQNETLTTLCADKDIDWSRVNAFHMDEYIGLDSTHPASFRNFLRKSIFDNFPFRSVNLLDGNTKDLQAIVSSYNALLSTHPIDLCLMGIGENGHIAFNDPSVADFYDPMSVKIVRLEDICRQQQVHDGCFTKFDQVPTHALTVTVPALMRAKKLVCSVPAATKASAAFAMVTGEISTACPASILRIHVDATLYLDVDSGSHLL